ncbi:unnamed protein product [Prorocentrum cordatum]|nr:unnamed protein product [Polarella glacialis]
MHWLLVPAGEDGWTLRRVGGWHDFGGQEPIAAPISGAAGAAPQARRELGENDIVECEKRMREELGVRKEHTERWEKMLQRRSERVGVVGVRRGGMLVEAAVKPAHVYPDAEARFNDDTGVGKQTTKVKKAQKKQAAAVDGAEEDAVPDTANALLGLKSERGEGGYDFDNAEEYSGDEAEQADFQEELQQTTSVMEPEATVELADEEDAEDAEPGAMLTTEGKELEMLIDRFASAERASPGSEGEDSESEDAPDAQAEAGDGAASAGLLSAPVGAPASGPSAAEAPAAGQGGGGRGGERGVGSGGGEGGQPPPKRRRLRAGAAPAALAAPAAPAAAPRPPTTAGELQPRAAAVAAPAPAAIAGGATAPARPPVGQAAAAAAARDAGQQDAGQSAEELRGRLVSFMRRVGGTCSLAEISTELGLTDKASTLYKRAVAVIKEVADLKKVDGEKRANLVLKANYTDPMEDGQGFETAPLGLSACAVPSVATVPRGRQHTPSDLTDTETIGFGDLRDSGMAATDARCLLWQGGERGCGEIRDRDLCLRSVDGRPWRQWRSYLIHGQPCAWCGGESCAANTNDLCMPADWVKGQPRVTVASCGAPSTAHVGAPGHGDSQPVGRLVPPLAAMRTEFEDPGRPGFGCGAEGAAVSSKVNKFFYTFTTGSLDECKDLCSFKAYCRAVEYGAHDGRCLLWWYPVQSMTPKPGHTCALVRDLSGNGAAARTPEPEEPNATAPGRSSEPNTTASKRPSDRENAIVADDAEGVGSAAAVSGMLVSGARAHSTDSDWNASLADAMEHDLRSTLTNNTTAVAFGSVNSSDADSVGWDSSRDIGRDMLTVSTPAREAAGSILKPTSSSDGTGLGKPKTPPGTTTDRASAVRRWAAVGGALCCGAACALLLGAATRAARARTTRAAELEEGTDSDACLSDDLEPAFLTAAAERTEPRAAPLPVLLGPAAGPPRGLPKRHAAAPVGTYALLPPRGPAAAAPWPPTLPAGLPSVAAPGAPGLVRVRPARPLGPAGLAAPAAVRAPAAVQLREPVARPASRR